MSNFWQENYENSTIPLHKLIKVYNKYLHKKYKRNDLNFGWKELTNGWKKYYESAEEYFKYGKGDEEPEPLNDEIGWIVWWCYTRAPEDIKCIFDTNSLITLIMNYHHIPNEYLELIQFIVKTIIECDI